MTLDEAKAAFDKLRVEWAPILKTIDNEANTRFKLIDQILNLVLGWHKLEDFSLEKHSESGYADYVLSADGRDRMVVEAKSKGDVLVDTSAKSIQYLAVKSAALKNAQVGLNQAQGYCVSTGTIFAVLTSGIEWVAYLAIREHGKKPSEGKVIVFPSLDAISQEFSQFWDLFSRQAVLEERFKVRIHEVEGLRIQSSEVLKPLLKTSDIRFLPKNKLALDLDRVFKEFFSSMAGENDPEMLAQCFVDSKESKEADINLEKIASSLIGQLELISSEEGRQLQQKMQNAIEAKHGDFVLIIGNKGAGKTTFIDRFFRLVLPSRLKESCTLIRIDVGDSTGDPSTIVSWLDQQILHTLEQTLFENGIATYDQLQGIFYSEYCRQKNGPFKILYDTNKDSFKIKFGEYLDELRTNQIHTYIEQLLRDIVNNRKKMPCLVFDNTDHFNEKFQEAVFQYAQSLFRRVFSFVICPITDRTIWELSKHGPLQSYDTTSFYLPVPAIKSVLEKRINFIRKKLTEGDQITRGEYFVGKGIRLSIGNIEAFAACIEEIFITNQGLTRIIGSFSNFDIRRCFQLTQNIVTSPHVKIDDLARIYLTSGVITINHRLIYMAILCNESNHFSQNSSNFVMNIFEVQGDDLTSPLIKLRILKFFMDIESQSGQDIQKSHAPVEDVINYFNSMGISQTTVKAHIQRLASSQLLATYDAAEQEIKEDSLLRITPSGKIHYEWAMGNQAYLTEAALVAPLRCCQTRDELMSLWSNQKKNRKDWDELARKFTEYCLEQDRIFCVVPEMESYKSQKTLHDQFWNRWARVPQGSDTEVD
ncbi:MAG: AAA family ATPase [Leptospirales bacterium]